MRRRRFAVVSRSVFLGATLVGVLATAVGLEAQALKDLQTPDTPLVLKAQGSFFIGGEKADETQVELGSLGPGATSPSTRCTCASWCRRPGTATFRW